MGSWSRGQRAADVGGLDVFTNDTERGSLPDWWIDTQAALGKQQAQRMRALGIKTILRGFEGNVPAGLKLKYPRANISASKAVATGQAWQLDALDPLFTTLADRYMRILIDTFGTDHFYQADGSFSAVPMPWLSAVADRTTKTKSAVRPPCAFTGPHNDSFIGNCAPPDGPNKCGGARIRNWTLAEAQDACAADVGCGGVTLECNDGQPGCVFSTRANRFLTPDPPKSPAAASWLISNADVCQ